MMMSKLEQKRHSQRHINMGESRKKPNSNHSRFELKWGEVP